LKEQHYRDHFEDIYKYVKGNTNKQKHIIVLKTWEWEASNYSMPHKMHSLTIVRVGMRLRNSSEKVSD